MRSKRQRKDAAPYQRTARVPFPAGCDLERQQQRGAVGMWKTRGQEGSRTRRSQHHRLPTTTDQKREDTRGPWLENATSILGALGRKRRKCTVSAPKKRGHKSTLEAGSQRTRADIGGHKTTLKIRGSTSDSVMTVWFRGEGEHFRNLVFGLFRASDYGFRPRDHVG